MSEQRNETGTAPGGPEARANGPQAANDFAAIKARLEAVEKERDEFKNQALRHLAEFDNYQKRAQRDLATERRYAQTPLARDLLPALDNLDRALAAARQGGENDPLVQGVGMVQTMLLDVLRRHGVTRVEPQGQPFDHDRHEAVMQQPSAGHPANTVVQVLEPGYLIHDRVLRPARVVVSTLPPS